MRSHKAAPETPGPGPRQYRLSRPYGRETWPLDSPARHPLARNRPLPITRAALPVFPVSPVLEDSRGCLTTDRCGTAGESAGFPTHLIGTSLASCAPDALIACVKVSAVRSRLLPYPKHLSGAP